MSIKIIACLCVLKGIMMAMNEMNRVRKYGRPPSSVDKNLFLYMIGND
jgi:hypothetical protein